MQLIATLPGPHRMALAEKMASHPLVGGLRFNTAMAVKGSPEDCLGEFGHLAARHGKPLFVDIKGRQPRVAAWSATDYDGVRLNREIVFPEGIDGAFLLFRGDDGVPIAAVDRDRLLLDGAPRHAAGAGQAVNIIGVPWDVAGGYLSEQDRSWLSACKEAGKPGVMLSFAEKESDVTETLSASAGHVSEIVLKIESPKGLDLVRSGKVGKATLMAARDDLFITVGGGFDTLSHVADIRNACRDAIAASRLLSGIADAGFPTLADMADLRLLELDGYRRFMLSDTISIHHFDQAMEAWAGFLRFSGRTR